MKVFISWSGTKSKNIGEIFRRWIPGVVQAVKPYFTPDDIAKGARWATDVAKELSDSKLGIFILTAENLTAPWIMFEAGAISKQIDTSRVCPLLFGLSPTDVKGPLEQFQCSAFSKMEVHKLLKSINGALCENALDSVIFDKVFDMWWPGLEADVAAVLQSETDSSNLKPQRSETDMLEELVTLARRTHTAVANGRTSRPFSPMAIEDLATRYAALLEQLVTTPPSPEYYQSIVDLAKPVRHIIERAHRPDDTASDHLVVFNAAYSRLPSPSDEELQKAGLRPTSEEVKRMPDAKQIKEDACQPKPTRDESA